MVYPNKDELTEKGKQFLNYLEKNCESKEEVEHIFDLTMKSYERGLRSSTFEEDLDEEITEYCNEQVMKDD